MRVDGGVNMARNEEPGMKANRNRTGGSGKWSKYTQKKAEVEADWSKVDMPTLFGAIVAITNAGGALLLGKTRDGGALVITVCEGDERAKFYATTREEAHEHLELITDNA